MKILTHPNEVLTTPSTLVEAVEMDDLIAQAKEMLKILITPNGWSNGVGLAAPQVGINKRFFVIADGSEIVINPTILRTGKEIVYPREGCLSIPHKFINKKRYAVLDAEYMNGEKKLIRRTFKRLEAQIFQHEMDHLDGVLCIQTTDSPAPQKVDDTTP